MSFQDLVKEQPLLGKIMDTILDGVVTIEHSDTFTFANTGAARIFGVSREEMENRKFGEQQLAMLSEDGVPLTGEDEPFAKVHRENSVVSAQKVFIQRPDGSKLPVLLNIGPIDLESLGRGMVGVFTDISSIAEAEALREDYQRAISHDLRLPLTIILGYSEVFRTILSGYDLPDDAWTAIDSIHRAASNMLVMINDLLEVARWEDHKIELNREAVHLDRFLPTLLQDSHTPKSADRFVLHVPPNLPPINADRDKLARVITNLLDNAVSYSDDSPIIVETAVSAGFVRISVRDKGKGFVSDKIPSMFDRFERGEKAEGEGFGLGLYIVWMLTKAHGGHVYVCSELGAGSTFSVYFPVLQCN